MPIKDLTASQKAAQRRRDLKKEKRCQRCQRRDARTKAGKCVCKRCNIAIMEYAGKTPGRKVGRPRVVTLK